MVLINQFLRSYCKLLMVNKVRKTGGLQRYFITSVTTVVRMPYFKLNFVC